MLTEQQAKRACILAASIQKMQEELNSLLPDFDLRGTAISKKGGMRVNTTHKKETNFMNLTVEFTPMGLAGMIADILCSKITTTTDEKAENTAYITKCCVERLISFTGDEAYDFVKREMKLHHTKLTKGLAHGIGLLK